MSTCQRIGEGIGFLIKALAITCAIFVPLGLWKLVEIIIWLVKHINIS